MDLQNAQKVPSTTGSIAHGVRYFNELTNMAQLTEEVGEVARIISRRYGEQSEKESDKNKDLGEELGRCFIRCSLFSQPNKCKFARSL